MQSPANTTPQPYADDEIDLFELFENLWKQKLLIALVTLVVTALGAGYAFMATPVYQATVHLLPPSGKDTAELRQLDLVVRGEEVPVVSVEPVPPHQIYEAFLQSLQSNATRKTLFAEADIHAHFLGENGDELKAWKRFNEAISVNLPKKGSPIAVSVSFKSDSAQSAADWANRYVDIAIERSRHQLAADLKEEIRSRINQLELEINSRRTLYVSQIDTELSKLKEALSIAKAMNLQEPLRTDSVIDDKNRTMMVDEIRRLYRSGSRALEAEITAVEARRKSEDFISGLMGLQQQKVLLETMTVNPANINPVKIDLEAQPDDTPIKPRKMLIVALSVILGGMAGVMIALVRTAIINRRQQIVAG